MIIRLRAGACLSLTGRFARLGRQAADGLHLWADASGADLLIADDESDTAVLTRRLAEVAQNADLLFGPYSTVLMRAAIPVAESAGRLLINHGGSGGDLSAPGRVVNILTPAARYADPFVDFLRTEGGSKLFTVAGRGTFGRDVVSGAESAAHRAGIEVARHDAELPPTGVWDLLSAGVYEDDVTAVRTARAMADPPRYLCSVAAGVTSFAGDIGDPEGVFGVGQWAPGTPGPVDVGMGEVEVLDAWRRRYGRSPDYPGVQAYAAGVVAEAAVRTAGSTDGADLWRTLVSLDFATVFGRFRIDPDGVQAGHRSVLTQWRGGVQVSVEAGA